MIWKALLISSLLVSCGTIDRIKREPAPQIITKWHTFSCGVPPHVDKVSFNPVVWEILEGRYTLTTDMYANLGDNMTLIKQASAQIVEVIRFYEKCILAAQEKEDVAGN